MDVGEMGGEVGIPLNRASIVSLMHGINKRVDAHDAAHHVVAEHPRCSRVEQTGLGGSDVGL